ncbi:hypothetical protein G6F70_000775 [Rhizopus microsporus]|uniref:ASX DEUBAD domain-containing protein n=1 Tax=Rhizopus microsporus TaxID=58291 RepID=A0A1X0S374_RHIZD|nr:hypothetical protein G6F71_000524 [Rhizopus microsporus]KAG1204119.1 hypothetical protein G6F70_000775 [Rhizopus microsporus]KAG1215462.1 hypothetical protein G6F69_000980 [Rhizopus microsporus]KAG1238010.1 hypothetical protein G6F67_000750 [Rhizopus microsporus]KAG1269317.1 hypothetical protein G6F68_000394 [Rhizopus microsporus]
MFSASPAKRELEEGSDILDPSQFMSYSPLIEDGSYKRPRYEHHTWTLDHLCTSPYSPLATVDLQSIFNLSNFQLLSQEKREELCQLLPVVDTTQNPQSSSLTISPSFFSKQTNPIFWDTLTEWQALLSQGEIIIDQPETTLQLKPKHKSKLKKPKITHHKDDPIDSTFGDTTDKEKAHNVAGDSKNITLKDMCRKGLIREEDVIVYKRNFSACKIVVCKSMTVVKASGLSGISIQLDGQIFEDFETPTALETKILDHHGKVSKDKRPNGNAFKSIRLIRAGKDLGRLFDIRKDSFEEP